MRKRVAAARVAEALRKKFSDQVGIAGELRRFSTGNLAIDRILGGGIPLGRVLELYGPYSSGKTLLATHILAEMQKMGGLAILGDVEGAYDPAYGKAIGVEKDSLVYWNPKVAIHKEESRTHLTVEDVTHFFISAVKEARSIDPSIPLGLVWDSIAAVSTRHELSEGLDKADMSKARMISAAVRLLNAHLGPNDTMIFINQIREKIGVMFGDPETTPGGKAIPFFASARLRLSQVKQRKEEKKAGTLPRTGLCKIVCTKNKTAPPLRWAVVEVSFMNGIDLYSGLLDLLVREEVVVRAKGGQYQYKGGPKFLEQDLPEIVGKNPWIIGELWAPVDEAKE